MQLELGVVTPLGLQQGHVITVEQFCSAQEPQRVKIKLEQLRLPTHRLIFREPVLCRFAKTPERQQQPGRRVIPAQVSRFGIGFLLRAF